MSEILPAPLTPADCDLRALGWFPFHHKRLPRSAWWLRASDTAKVASIELWCEAYQQVPAGSLPDDDVALSDAAGFGRREISAWLAIKDEVMAAWTRCSDGRWYHPTLCEVALDAWETGETARREWREKKQKRRAKGDAEATPPPNPEPATSPVENSDVPGGQADFPQGEFIDFPEENSDVPGGKPPLQDNTIQEINLGSSLNLPSTAKRAERASPASRGKRLPDGWTPGEPGLQYARAKGFRDQAIHDMFEAFTDWWKQAPGQKGVKLDWDATWRTWVRNQKGTANGSGNHSGFGRGLGASAYPNRGGQGVGTMADVLFARRRAEQERDEIP